MPYASQMARADINSTTWGEEISVESMVANMGMRREIHQSLSLICLSLYLFKNGFPPM